MKYTIVLEYQGKQYTFLDRFDEYEGWDADRNSDYQVEWMYTEGNYACDCNRSRFIGVYCEEVKLFPVLPCGREISLVSICDGDRIVWRNKDIS